MKRKRVMSNVVFVRLNGVLMRDRSPTSAMVTYGSRPSRWVLGVSEKDGMLPLLPTNM